jgi:outer membrane protein assembly factor BamB
MKSLQNGRTAPIIYFRNTGDTGMWRNTLVLSAVWLLGVSPVVGVETAANWPGWRGANRDGKSTDTGLLKAWPEGGPKKLWTCDQLGEGYSSVAVADGVIYATGLKDKKLHLLAILAGDGTVVWETLVGPGWTDSHPGTRATPVVDEGRIYLVTGPGSVSCYDAGKGEKLWTRSLGEFGGKTPRWGFAESVLIVGDKAVVTPGGGKTAVVALDKKSGKTLWQSEPWGAAAYSSAILVDYQGAKVIVQGTEKGLIALNPANGKTFWTMPFRPPGRGSACATPAFADGYIFWAVGYKTGCLGLKLTGGKEPAARKLYENHDMENHHGGFVIVDGHAYGYCDKNGWTCIDVKTGRAKWMNAGVGKGSICYADGMLYLFGEKGGRVGLVPASPEKLELVGDFRVSGSGPSWAHPVVTGGRLYLRYANNLYCYDVKEEK